MGVMTILGENMTQKMTPNVLMETLTERGARATAAMLKRRGYEKATIENCRRRSPIEIAKYFEPLDEEAREELIRQIARAAKLQP
jgi:DNA-binding MarR family transcriptional regulator